MLDVEIDTMKKEEIMRRIEEGIQLELQEAKDFEEQLQREMRANQEKSEHQKRVDERMMLIQKTFEEWVTANGGPKKALKGKGKKNK